MKRVASLFLIVSMLLFVFATAAPEDNSDNTQTVNTLTLSLADIEKQVLKNNTVVRSNNNTLENMKDPDGLKAARDDLFTQAAKIDMSFGSLLAASGGEVSTELLQLSYAANALRSQARQLEAPEKDEIEETGWQLSKVNYTLVTAVESMYTSCLSMERQLSDMKKSAEVMDRNLEAMKLRNEFGQVSSLDLDGFVSQKESLDSGIITLESGLRSLYGEINIQLGRAFDAPLELASPGVPDLTYLEKIDRSKDLQAAKEASFALKIKRRAIKDADDTAYDDRQYNTFKRDYENKVMDAAAEEETIRFTQDKLLDAISEKTRAYKLAQDNRTLEKKKLESYELKYEFGTISEIDLLGERLSLSEQETKTQNASDALCAAIKTYQWFLRGIYSSSGGAAGTLS